MSDLVQDRVATVNVFTGLNDEDAEAAVRAVLLLAPGLVSLHEWGSNRRAILQRIAKTTRYRWARPEKGGGPELWDSDRYGLQRCGAIRLARAEWVGHLIGRKPRLPDSWMTECVFEDEFGGPQVVTLGWHLTAEVQLGADYRKDWKHRLRVWRHKREVRRIRRRQRHHIRKGRVVYSKGDGNFDGLRLPPLHSCWENHPGGTLGPRAVDVVAGPTPAKSVRVVRTKSDHGHPVANFTRSL